MTFRTAPPEQPIFVGSIEPTERRSPVAWVPSVPFVFPPLVLVFVFVPGMIGAFLLRVNPLLLLVPLLLVFGVVFSVASNAYTKSLRAVVEVWADRIVMKTKRRAVELDRRGLAVHVEVRAWYSRRLGHQNWTCLELRTATVHLSVGTAGAMGAACGKTGIPHLTCDAPTLRGLAAALAITLPGHVNPPPK